jgi:hypothetical protein
MLDHYREYLNNRRETNIESGKTDMMFRISSVGLCERKNVYNALGFEKKYGPVIEADLSLYIGTVTHELIQDHFMDAGIIDNMRDKDGRPTEVEIIRPDLKLSGHVDGVYTHSNGRGVFEFKTTNSMAFVNFVLFMKKPKKAHIEQANTYAGLLGANQITVIYYNKNGLVDKEYQQSFIANGYSQSFAEFTLDFDKDLFNKTLDKIKRMSYYVDSYQDTGDLPKKIYDNQCSYCPFLWTCKPKGDEKPSRAKKTVQEL